MAIEKITEENLGDFVNYLNASGLGGWSVVGGKLRKTFLFSDFIARVAIVAEKKNHHPEGFNVYNKVIVDLITHDTGGISTRDFDLAEGIDRLTAEKINSNTSRVLTEVVA